MGTLRRKTSRRRKKTEAKCYASANVDLESQEKSKKISMMVPMDLEDDGNKFWDHRTIIITSLAQLNAFVLLLGLLIMGDPFGMEWCGTVFLVAYEFMFAICLWVKYVGVNDNDLCVYMYIGWIIFTFCAGVIVALYSYCVWTGITEVPFFQGLRNGILCIGYIVAIWMK